MIAWLKRLAAFATGVCVSAGAWAEELPVGYSLYGTPGLIDMPSAMALPDGQFGVTLGGFANQQRGSFTFQISPRLTGTFRYSRFADFTGPDTDDLFDRSFDLQYQILTEGPARPAVAVGLRDFLGTGLYTGEYIVATKSVGSNVRVTGGLGWGRLASNGGFTNPLGLIDDRFEVRPAANVGSGGTPAFEQFFRGDAAVFGGVEWQIRDDVTFVAEYSSDAYTRESGLGVVSQDGPVSFGVRYRPRPTYELGAYLLHGNEIGFSATLITDPGARPAPSGFDAAPIPVAVRAADVRAAQTWDQTPQNEQILLTGIAAALELDGIVIHGIDFGPRSIRVRYSNETYRAEAQAIGHIARALTVALPPAIETFTFEPMRRGIPVSSVTLQRADLEELENTSDAAWHMLARSEIGEAGDDAGFVIAPSTAASFEWGIVPYVELALFDGNSPIRTDYGVEARARYEIRPNIVLSGSVRYSLGGDIAQGAISPSTLHPVRRNASLYGASGGILLEDLALHWYGRPGENLYSRVSAGYLEQMFAGVSGEILWKPVGSRFALGGELSYVAQRSYDMGFGLQNFANLGGSYQVLTGHVSAYYDFANGYSGRVDVGRYLAGDWGATVAINREFSNGWRLGAYATLTDVPFADFGEGSFDKGVLLTIPLDWGTGSPSRQQANVNLSSLLRDGGARLNIDGRLYDTIRDGHSTRLEDSWGRFWR